jgi:F-type H+-transporting ATPase subunit c
LISTHAREAVFRPAGDFIFENSGKEESIVKNWKIMVLVVSVLLLAPAMFGVEAVTTTTTTAGGVKWGALAAAFVLGISAAAGAIGQSRAIAAACEGIARNPGAAGPIRLAMIIGLALIESLVIYALIIAFIAVNK